MHLTVAAAGIENGRDDHVIRTPRFPHTIKKKGLAVELTP